MHVANPLSRRSDHYVHSSEDNKEQVLLQPETVNKIIDASEKSHDDRQSIISEFHDLPAAGHKGSKATYNALRKHYRWKGMKEQVQQYIKHCQCCQKNKATVTAGSPRRSGQRTEVVRRSERSQLQRTESSVAVHTAARESRSAGIKTEQAREEGDAPDREQQRDSCPSQATSVGFGQGVGHLPVSVT